MDFKRFLDQNAIFHTFSQNYETREKDYIKSQLSDD